jgi:hypothetical protein
MWKEEDPVVDYPISSADTLDDDLKETQKHMAAAEATLGKWDYQPAHAGYVQLDKMKEKQFVHDWTNTRHHFRNNYVDWSGKRVPRAALYDQMQDNWGTMRY